MKKKLLSILEKWLNKCRMFLKIEHMNYTQRVNYLWNGPGTADIICNDSYQLWSEDRRRKRFGIFLLEAAKSNGIIL